MKHVYTLFILLFSGFAFSQVLGIQSFASGLVDPVEIVNAGDARLFVVQQAGQIKIVNPNGTINATNFLNIDPLTNGGGEQGLLGLAFHPNYATNGFFYVNYTNNSGNTVIARYSVDLVNSPNVATANSAVILKTITQPASNHNGGTIKFGADGYLYIGMGDGGGGGDQQNNGQNKNTLLGKMLRIDVNNGTPYGIPTDNPFVGVDGADEIWAVGLRNPWKFSFDSETNDLWIADVGQENVEEINKMPATTAGLNYGWRCYEGNAAYNTSGCAAQGTMTFPFTTYSSASGSGNCSITGGYVYRGSTYPNLQGKYIFADYCSSKIGMVNASGTTGTATFTTSFSEANFSTFGVDMNKELYVAGISNGIIYKVIDTSLSTDEKNKNQFSVFPNPAKNNFSVKTNADFPLQIFVFDITGKKLIDKTLQAEGTLIDSDLLQSGMYIVTLEDKTGAKSSSKLMIE